MSRRVAPAWAVWSLMTGLYTAVGNRWQAEIALVNLTGALSDEHVTPTGVRLGGA